MFRIWKFFNKLLRQVNWLAAKLFFSVWRITLDIYLGQRKIVLDFNLKKYILVWTGQRARRISSN